MSEEDIKVPNNLALRRNKRQKTKLKSNTDRRTQEVKIEQQSQSSIIEHSRLNAQLIDKSC